MSKKRKMKLLDEEDAQALPVGTFKGRGYLLQGTLSVAEAHRKRNADELKAKRLQNALRSWVLRGETRAATLIQWKTRLEILLFCNGANTMTSSSFAYEYVIVFPSPTTIACAFGFRARSAQLRRELCGPRIFLTQTLLLRFPTCRC